MAQKPRKTINLSTSNATAIASTSVDKGAEQDCKKHGSLTSVLVVLGHYNGNRFINEQLNSIFTQSHQNIDIHISDDDSSFDPDHILDNISEDYRDRLSFSQNTQNLGFCKNFLFALANTQNHYPYYAFSDQDDIWYPEKVARAISILSSYSEEEPSLYCSRTAIFDEQCEKNLGFSPLFKKQPSFANALVQNIAGGNTMVLNKAARALIVKATPENDVIAHDWWCYQIVAGAGGNIYYDPNPSLKYRQHSTNEIGSNNGLKAKILRIKGLFSGNLRSWNDANCKALFQNKHLLTEANKALLNNFITARNAKLHKRILFFINSGIHRQTLLGNIGLLIGLIFRKV